MRKKDPLAKLRARQEELDANIARAEVEEARKRNEALAAAINAWLEDAAAAERIGLFPPSVSSGLLFE